MLFITVNGILKAKHYFIIIKISSQLNKHSVIC